MQGQAKKIQKIISEIGTGVSEWVSVLKSEIGMIVYIRFRCKKIGGHANKSFVQE